MMVAWAGAVVDEQAKREIKEILMQYDRTLLVADPRRCEPKKYVIAVLLSLHCPACVSLFGQPFT